MRYDFASIEDTRSFASVPEGFYTAKIAEVRAGESKDGSARWSLRLEVTEGDYAGRTAAWDSITWSERGLPRVKLALKAFGFDVEGVLDIEIEELVDRRVRTRVEPEEREDPQTGEKVLRMRVPYRGYWTLEGEEISLPDENPF